MRVFLLAGLVACGGGGGSIAGDPLIQSTLTAEFNNKPWTPMYGFGRMEETAFILRVGSTKISCADDFEGEPRDGTYGVTGITGAPAIGNSTPLFNLTEVTGGDLTGKGSTGSLMITAVSATEISAVFGFSTTIDNGRYALMGAVTMLVCP